MSASPRSRRSQLAIWFVVLAALSVAVATRATAPGPVNATEPPGSEPARADPRATSRLLWMVADLLPVVYEGTDDCLVAGPGCDTDRMLNTDTTALRAEALSAALAEVLRADPDARPDLGDDLLDLTARTATAATSVSAHLRAWLDTGCGSNVGGVVIDTHPPECGERTAAARAALTALADVLARWPTP